VCVRHADVDQRLAGHENLGQLVHGQRCRWLPGSSARVARPKHSLRSTAAVQPLREITDDATDMPGPEYASMRLPRLNARKSVNRRISFYDARAFRAQHLPTRDVRSTDSVAPHVTSCSPQAPRSYWAASCILRLQYISHQPGFSFARSRCFSAKALFRGFVPLGARTEDRSCCALWSRLEAIGTEWRVIMAAAGR
jgi:hypothetical protein